MPRVFVSYNHKDSQLAEEIAASLKSRDFTIAIDREVLSPGDDWQKVLLKELQSSDIVAALITEHSSQNVLLEMGAARGLGNIVLVPIVVGNIKIPSPIADINAILIPDTSTKSVETAADGIQKAYEAFKTRKDSEKEAELKRKKEATLKCACLFCGHPTNHSIVYSFDTKDPESDFDVHYQVVQCMGCDAKSFRYSDRNPLNGFLADGTGFREVEHLFPPRHLLRNPVDMYWLPVQVRRIYRELQLSLRNGMSTFAAFGIRATVEALCQNKKAGTRSLKSSIDKLYANGVITQSQMNALHSQRMLGNEAVHEFAEPSDDELIAAMDVLDKVLDSIYVMPARHAHMESLGRQRKKKNN
jgi:hypothetical protein